MEYSTEIIAHWGGDQPILLLAKAFSQSEQPLQNSGQNAAELLIELIESRKAEEIYTTVKLKTTLDIQESSLRKTQ